MGFCWGVRQGARYRGRDGNKSARWVYTELEWSRQNGHKRNPCEAPHNLPPPPTAIDTNSTLANNTAWLATNLLQMYLSKYANGANFLGDNVGISIIFVKVRTATIMRIYMVGKASCWSIPEYVGEGCWREMIVMWWIIHAPLILRCCPCGTLSSSACHKLYPSWYWGCNASWIMTSNDGF